MPDLLFLSEDSRLEFAYPRIGLTGDGGATFYLPRLVGLRAAKEIVLMDEPISPQKAVDLGLATEVLPVDELDEVAADLASGPTRALGSTISLLTESFDRSFESQLAAELDTIATATETEDYRRGYEAFFGDDEPKFTGE